MYTRDDWRRDRTFSANPGEEISEEVYDEFYNNMPPMRLPVSVVDKYGLDGGFMNSEPYSFKNGKPTYAAFGRKDSLYFFLGYFNEA